jgi:hypothetical protein
MSAPGEPEPVKIDDRMVARVIIKKGAAACLSNRSNDHEAKIPQLTYPE